MVTRADIVAEARQWIGTRYQHQGRSKQVATDCGGLVYGVGFALGLLPDVRDIPQAKMFAGYARQAANGSLLRACQSLLLPASTPHQAGDVVLMQFTGEPQHVGIFGDYRTGSGLSIIHAYAPLRRVVEHRLDDTWRARIVAAWRFPGVEE